jgi:hypothetical protein
MAAELFGAGDPGQMARRDGDQAAAGVPISHS